MILYLELKLSVEETIDPQRNQSIAWLEHLRKNKFSDIIMVKCEETTVLTNQSR